MELYQLRAFLAVARSGQLLRACEQLHLTQSAVSKQIKSLEDELGMALFEREPTGMVLNGAGRRLLPLAARTIDAASAMASLAASIRGAVSGKLRLGTIIDPDSIRLGPLLAALVQSHPHVDVSLVHGISGSVLKMLREHRLDACFYLGKVDDPQIAAQPLRLEHYVIVAPAEWTQRMLTATWNDLAKMPWLAAPPESSQHGLVTELFAERGLTFSTVVEADQEASMIELVQAGVALGLMRERVVEAALRTGQLVAWGGARLPCPLSLLYRRADEDGAVMQALLTTLQTVWQPEVLR